ncbi:peptidase [Prevotella intermedia]|uniref:peptidase n=1 Tax=Prevotella intermedia TaxID=28131 RepID=UPI001E2CF3CE|nr:peptidase [Prevotella intermedia]
MKTNLLKNVYLTIAALLVAMFALPATMYAQTEYALTIAGTKVTSANCNDLSKINGVSGTVKYNPTTKVLTLQNAVIKSTGENEGIDSKIGGLTISVIGTNSITASGFSALRTDQTHTTIKGGGKLVLSGEYFGLYAMWKSSVTIEDCEIECDGSFGTNNNNAEITIDNATVTAKGNTFETMRGIQKLTLNGCAITEPEGAVYDPTLRGVALNGKLVRDKVVIKDESVTKYGLTICGEEVTSANCGNLSVIDGVSGTVSYDPGNKLLTLQNATISYDKNNAIVSYIDGLMIKVIGTNTLAAVDNATLSFREPLTIMGGGVLNVKSKSDCAIFANETNLTIDNCTVNAESGAYGIAGKSGSSEKFTIRNATVTAIGTGYGSICDFAELNLKGCYITEPSGATFSSSMHGIVLNGEIVKSKVVIKKDPTAIETPTADNTAVQGIYTLSGVRMSGELKDLPKGVYIVNGKKVVKQ